MQKDHGMHRGAGRAAAAAAAVVLSLVAERGPSCRHGTACAIRSGRPRNDDLSSGERVRAGDSCRCCTEKDGSGAKFHARAEAFAWGATAVPYRCDIQFGGANTAGDSDPTNDFAEFTFPKF